MKLDNQKNTYRIWLSRMVMAIVFTFSILILIFIPWFEDRYPLFTKYHMIMLIAIIYVAINMFNAGKSQNFISYSDHGEMIIFRYYPLSLFNSKKNSIEIPKQQFVRYELKPFFFKRYQKIVLYQRFRGKVVGYPPVSLSALDKGDRERMFASLGKYIKS